jgi:hypothetical protein
MSTRTKILVVVILPVLAIGSLYLRSLVRRRFFESSSGLDASARARLAQAALQSSGGPTQTVTLYFPSYGEGKLRAETRPLALAADPADRIRQIVLALIEGPYTGQARALPPSADVRAAFLTADGNAYLDFSSAALTGFNPGIESETLTVYSVVESLVANLPEVKRVQFLVQGQETETLDGHADLTEPFAPDPSRIATGPPPAAGPGGGPE